MIKVGVIGAAGYTGGELIRLLVNHPEVELTLIHSKSNGGNPVSDVHQDLINHPELVFTSVLSDDVDVLFLCLGHGNSKKFLEENTLDPRIRIIDLANDFRLVKDAKFGDRDFIYGLPEINKQAIVNAHDVANPGCFATSIQLGLLPLAQENLLKEIYTTGITGSTGAGQSLSPTTHFSWRDNNIQAYKTLTHQHLDEIQQSLHQLQPGLPTWSENKEVLNFVPWRGDFPRGIYISSTLNCDLSLGQLNELYKAFYKDARFTVVCDKPIFLKQVVNTNNCVLFLEKVGGKLVVHSATDNLLKGASGQAVQNMNLMFGLEEATGLNLKANYF
ncbi:MAG TPA: N-acetyl-gamma-glutamyl-phosphate reductase [Arachidicoccus sp.]|nr:N-acetyl-gamma-glutamyl-phosphate reductase [Arachidicoccus sp.]